MLAFHFPPVAAAGSFRSLRFAKYLPDFGWRPLVVSLAPEYSQEKVDLALAESLPAAGIYRRTPIWYLEDHLNRIAHTVARRAAAGRQRDEQGPRAAEAPTPGGASQLLRHLRDFALRTPDPWIAWKRPALRAAEELIRRYRPEIIYSTGPPHSVHLIAARLQRRHRIAWVADFRDPWARLPWASTIQVDNPWGRRLLGYYERRCVSCADAVVLNTRRMQQDFVDAYREQPRERFHTIYNGFDPDLIPAITGLNATRPPGGESDRGRRPLRLCHAGSLYGCRDPRPLIAAIRQLADGGCDVELELIGHVDRQFNVPETIALLGLQHRVRVVPHLPHADVLKRMGGADVLLVIQPDTRLQVPGKLFEMLMFRKPILALTDEGETADLVVNHGIGEAVSATRTDAIARAVQRVRTCCPTPEVWERAVCQFDGRKLTGELADLFSHLAKSARGQGESPTC
jgi:glycosyltransferase involved in cell wall biosynthesis